MPSLPLALTQGDPAGIGPELSLRAWHERREHALPVFACLANPDQLARTADRLGWPIPIRECGWEEAASVFSEALPVIPLAQAVDVAPGKPDPASAAATIASIDLAVAAVQDRQAGAVVTNPIAKSVLYAAGFKHPGHTEYLAHLAGKRGIEPLPVMMLWCEELTVVPVTIHVPLQRVPSLLTTQLIVDTARIVATGLRRQFGIASPRLAIAGLNPHAGENGTMGREDEEIDVVRRETGPLDRVRGGFGRERRGALVRRRDATLADAAAFDDPLVGGVDARFEIRIRDPTVGYGEPPAGDEPARPGEVTQSLHRAGDLHGAGVLAAPVLQQGGKVGGQRHEHGKADTDLHCGRFLLRWCWSGRSIDPGSTLGARRKRNSRGGPAAPTTPT